MCSQLQNLYSMKKKLIFSKTLIVKILCTSDIFELAFTELKEVKFGDAVFDYIDVDIILSSSLTYEQKDALIIYLMRQNKIEINFELIKTFSKFSRLEVYEKIMGEMIREDKKTRWNILKVISYTNRKSTDLDNVDFSAKPFKGYTISYDIDSDVVVYKDFAGSIEKGVHYIKSLPKSKYLERIGAYLFFIKCAIKRKMYLDQIHQAH